MQRLMELSEPSGLFDRPTGEEIEAENEAIAYEAIAYEAIAYEAIAYEAIAYEAIAYGLSRMGKTAPAPSSMDISARQVVIQRANMLNVYTTGPDAYE